MVKACPKCGYERTDEDAGSAYECPKCGVIYAKVGKGRKAPMVERPAPDVPDVKEKSLALAIGLNFIFPGLGYMYMGKWIVGIFAAFLIAGIALVAMVAAVPVYFGLNVIMVIDMMILSSKNKKKVIEATTKKCPNCAETIKREARVCRFCNTRFDDGSVTP